MSAPFPLQCAKAWRRKIWATQHLCCPSYTKDLWGLKTFGMNYGILFTAWGMGGFVLSRLQQMLFASSKDFNSSFMTAAVLLVAGAGLTFFLKPRDGESNIDGPRFL